MRRKKRKRFRAGARFPQVLTAQGNRLGTMDFTRYSLANGWNFRALN